MKSQHCHQQQVERYHKAHDLAAKQVDVTNIARQVGLCRQGVYNYLRMRTARLRASGFISQAWHALSPIKSI